MSKTILKIRSFATGAFLALAFALALPGMASAGEQTLTAGFSLTPQSGQFLNNGFTPANWTVDNSVATVDPLEPEILPTKKIDLTLPPSSQMTFNPGNLAVCPDSAVNPGNVSVPVPTIVARCPDAVIGNGTAKFVLNRNNLSPQAVLDGVVVVFNGGLQNGRPLVKIYAYSYDTMVGIYSEAALQTDGSLDFNIPQLSFDSSVSELNLALPSQNITLNNQGPGAETVVLPKGEKSDYVQAKCSTGSFNWATDFTFGTRDNDGTPTSPDTFASDAGSQACTGVAGKGRVANVKVKLKNRRLRACKKARIGVTVRNGGNATLKKVRVKMRTNRKRLIKLPRRVVFKNIKPGGRNSKSKKVVVRAKCKAKRKKVKIVARAGNQKGKLKIFVRP